MDPYRRSVTPRQASASVKPTWSVAGVTCARWVMRSDALFKFASLLDITKYSLVPDFFFFFCWFFFSCKEQIGIVLMYKEKHKKAVFKTFFKAFLEQNTEQKIFCMQWIYFKTHYTYKCIFCMVCKFHILKFWYKLVKSIAPLGKNPSMKKVAKYLVASGIQKSRKLVYSCCDYSAITFFFFFSQGFFLYCPNTA